MFLTKDEFETNAWHMAIDEGQIEVLQQLWGCGKNILTAEELKSMF